jgi:uncharacterized protein (DUF1499 family)
MNVLRKIGVLLAILVVLRGIAAFIWPTINDVKTGGTPEYADLKPQSFGGAPERVFAEALAVAEALGWEVTSQDAASGEIQAVATTRIFRFKDDVTITVGRGAGGSTINVRSRSRIGKGDLGANARRIRLFQAELAKRFSPTP